MAHAISIAMSHSPDSVFPASARVLKIKLDNIIFIQYRMAVNSWFHLYSASNIKSFKDLVCYIKGYVLIILTVNDSSCNK